MNKMSVKEHIEMYWKFFFEKAEKTPDESLPQQQLQISELLDSQNNGLRASWLGPLLLHSLQAESLVFASIE